MNFRNSLLIAAALFGLAVEKADASALAINVYRQTDYNDKMGNGGTIAQQGCMMTSLAMVYRVSPATLNAWLNANGGYADGGNLKHSVAAAYDGAGGVQFVGFGKLPPDWASVDRGIARGAIYIVRSSRRPEHWVIVFKAGNGQSYYADPLDGTVRRVGDAYVKYGNEARIYSK